MYPQRLEERRAWLRRGFSAAVQHAIDARAHLFLQAGDLFDSPDPRNLERQFVAAELARLKDAGIACLGITGNHDTPRSRSGSLLATPQATYARLGGMQLLGEGDAAPPLDAETLVLEGFTVAVGGMAPDPLAPAGSDPVEGLDWHPDSDLAILLLHGSLEGHIYPGAPEPVIRRASVERLSLDCLLVGHVHKYLAARWGGTTVTVPGATERMTFGELDARPGFMYLELEPGRPPQLRHIAVDSQPRLQLTVRTADLDPDDPAAALIAMLDSECDRRTMVRMSLEGPITRQRYHDLRLRELAEHGAARAFFFDLDTTGLYVEDRLALGGARGGRLSPREELVRYGEEVRAAAAGDRERALVDEAMQAILSEYE